MPETKYDKRDAIVDQEAYKRVMAAANAGLASRSEVADQRLDRMVGEQVLRNIGTTTSSLGARVTDFLGVTDGKADELNRINNAYQAAATARHKEIPYVPEVITRGAVGVASQLPFVYAGGIAGGAKGAIGLFSAEAANQSYTQAIDVGLNQSDALAYASTQGMIEGLVTLAFQRVGLGGLESIPSELTRSATKQAIKRGITERAKDFVFKDLTPELIEEITIETLANVDTAMAGVDPNSADWGNQLETAVDTTVQTLMMTGAARGINYVGDRMRRAGATPVGQFGNSATAADPAVDPADTPEVPETNVPDPEVDPDEGDDIETEPESWEYEQPDADATDDERVAATTALTPDQQTAVVVDATALVEGELTFENLSEAIGRLGWVPELLSDKIKEILSDEAEGDTPEMDSTEGDATPEPEQQPEQPEAPAEEPVDQPAEQPVEEAVDQPAEAPAETPTDKIIGKNNRDQDIYETPDGLRYVFDEEGTKLQEQGKITKDGKLVPRAKQEGLRKEAFVVAEKRPDGTYQHPIGEDDAAKILGGKGKLREALPEVGNEVPLPESRSGRGVMGRSENGFYVRQKPVEELTPEEKEFATQTVLEPFRAKIEKVPPDEREAFINDILVKNGLAAPPEQPAEEQPEEPAPAPKGPTMADWGGDVNYGGPVRDFSPGQSPTTGSGRTATPFPTIDTSSDRKAKNSIQRVDEWLRENAIAEAAERGDDFAKRNFEASDLSNFTPADRDAMEDYLFGGQEAPAPKKKLGSKPAESSDEAPEPASPKLPRWKRLESKAATIPRFKAKSYKDLKAVADSLNITKLPKSIKDTERLFQTLRQEVPLMLERLHEGPVSVVGLTLEQYDALDFLRNNRMAHYRRNRTYVSPAAEIERTLQTKFPGISRKQLDHAQDLVRDHMETIKNLEPGFWLDAKDDYSDPRIWSLDGRSLKMNVPVGDRPHWYLSELDEAKKKPKSVVEFADEVLDIANKMDDSGRFGSSKVFINRIFESMRERNPELTRDEFNRQILAANKAEELTLSRADLVGAMDPKNVSESLTKDGVASFHFVRTDSDEFRPSKKKTAAVGSPEPGSDAPSPKAAGTKTDSVRGEDQPKKSLGKPAYDKSGQGMLVPDMVDDANRQLEYRKLADEFLGQVQPSLSDEEADRRRPVINKIANEFLSKLPEAKVVTKKGEEDDWGDIAEEDIYIDPEDTAQEFMESFVDNGGLESLDDDGLIEKLDNFLFLKSQQILNDRINQAKEAAKQKEAKPEPEAESTKQETPDDVSEDDLMADIMEGFANYNAESEPEQATKPKPTKKGLTTKKPKAKKPSTKKPSTKKPKSKKPLGDRIKDAAEKANDEADDLWDQLRDELDGLASSNPFFNPKLQVLAARLVVAEIKRNTLNFAVFVTNGSERIGEARMRMLAPLLEHAWQTVKNKRGFEGMDDAGDVNALLNDAKENEATEQFFESQSEGVPAYVISGMQRGPKDISSHKFTGRPVGVSVLSVKRTKGEAPRIVTPSQTVIDRIAHHANRGNTVFVDSGMYGLVSLGEPGAEPDWNRVFEQYDRIIEQVEPPYRHLVLMTMPDYLVKDESGTIQGDQDKTLELQKAHAKKIQEYLDAGVSPILPVQRGFGPEAMDLPEAASLATDEGFFDSGRAVFGIPYNAAPWSDDQILDLVKTSIGTGLRLHLLGGGKVRAEKLWDKIKAIDPTVVLTGDAATEVRNRVSNEESAETGEQEPRQDHVQGGESDQGGSRQDPGDRSDADGPANGDVLDGASAEDGSGAGGSRGTVGVRDASGGKVRQGDGSAGDGRGDGSGGRGDDGRGASDSGTGGTRGNGGRTGTGGSGGRTGGRGRDLAPKSSRPNYHLTDFEKVVGGGQKEKFRRNQQAIEIVQRLQERGDVPTSDELDILAAYTGWGAFGQELFDGSWQHPKPKKGWEEEDDWLRSHLGEEDWRSAQNSIKNAHYTDPETVTAIWDAIRRMGFDGGMVLEPSMGIGNFFSLMPRDLMAKSRLNGIELDATTAAIAKALHPQANIHKMGYEQSKTPDNFYDLIVSNVPFGDYRLSDRKYKQDYLIHNYFFKKAMDQVKPGGIVAFITSAGTMSGVGEAKLLRHQLHNDADLVSAIRLPGGAFQRYAGTKVVTDLIILRKRKPGEEPKEMNWGEVVEVPTPEGTPVKVNEYFEANPKQILGTLNHGHGTTSGRPGMIVEPPADLKKELAKAIKRLPEGIFNTERLAVENQIRSNTTARRQNSVVEEDGEFFVVKGEHLVPLTKDGVGFGWYREGTGKKKIEQRRQELRSFIELRETYRDLLDKQRFAEDTTDARKALNDVYDKFKKKYGPVAKSYASETLRKAQDPMAGAMLSLERRTVLGTYEKRAIFNKNTVRQEIVVENPTISDAFAIARNRSLDLDMDEIAKMAKVPVEEAIKKLVGDGSVYKTGNGTYDAADVFLSGNMARKLRELEAAQANGMDGLEDSIKAVKAKIPTPIPYSAIEVKIGVTWIPSEDYQGFIGHLLGSDSNEIEIRRGPGRWKVRIPKSLNDSSEATTLHGHPSTSFSRIVAAAMNNGSIKVYEKDAEGNKVFNEEATNAVIEKIDALRLKFSAWLWSDPERLTRLSSRYNEEFNSTVTPDFASVPLRFIGMALERGEKAFNLRKHQAAAVWRGIVSGKGIFSHEVGTGKTLTMGALAMESRRLGLAKKPILLAHNANSMAVYHEIQEAYPGANILYVDNLDPKRKDETLASIAAEDWDLIIVPHSLVDNFQMRPETVEGLLREEMLALEAAAHEAFNEDESGYKGQMPSDLDNISKEDMKKLKSPTAKELVTERNKLRARIVKAAQAAQKDSSIFFEDMGVDMVMVDEAHVFKKLPISTTQRIKGLNKKASDRGTLLMMMADHIRKNNGGRGVYTFTGTPITNTINEIFNQMRLVMPDEMESAGVKDWDGWFNAFAQSETTTELSSGGTWENFDRLASFVNLPELRQMVGRYMDTVFADQMEEFKPRDTRDGRVPDSQEPIGRPYKQIVNETIEMSPLQRAASNDLKERYTRFKKASGKEKKRMMLSGGKHNPLVIEQDGVKLAMDPRLAEIDVKDPKDPSLKVNRMISKAMPHYHEHPKSVQMIFMQVGHSDYANRTIGRNKDGTPITQKVRVFNLAKEIKRRLIEEGVPESEIFLMSSIKGKAGKVKKAQIAAAMRRGEIRFAIGSTETMGTGVNAQDNMVAMHHLDAPWMPGDLEQRNGRGHRQGNRWNTVFEYRYLTEGPQDGRRWQVLLTKHRFIQKFMRSDGSERSFEMDDVDMSDSGEGSDMEQSFAAAAGDPRIMLRVRLEGQIRKLEAGRRIHGETIQATVARANHQQRMVPGLEQDIALLESDYQTYLDNPTDKPQIMVRDQFFEGKDAVNNALKSIEDRYRNTTTKDAIEVGQWRGLTLRVDNGNLFLGEYKASARYDLSSLINLMANVPKRAQKLKDQVAKYQAFSKLARESIGTPFPKQETLDNKRKKLAELVAEMEAYEPSPSWFRNGAPVGSSVYIDSKDLEKLDKPDAKPGVSETPQKVPQSQVKDIRGLQTKTRSFGPVNDPKVDWYKPVPGKLIEFGVTGHREMSGVLVDRNGETVALPADLLVDENRSPIYPDLERKINEHNKRLADAEAEMSAAERITEEVAKEEGDDDSPPEVLLQGKLKKQAPLPLNREPGLGKKIRSFGKKATQVSAADFANTLSRMFGVPIRRGKFRQRAAGIYKWLVEVVRMENRDHVNIGTATHEVAHHLDKKTNAVRTMPEEMKTLVAGYDYMEDRADPVEGWAEFIRLFITMHDTPHLKKDKFYDWFTKEWAEAHPDWFRKIAKAQSLAKRFTDQTVFERIDSAIQNRPPKRLDGTLPNVLESLESALVKSKIHHVDQFYALKVIEEQAELRGLSFAEKASAYELISASYRSAISHAQRALYDGVRTVSATPRKLSDGFMSQWEDFTKQEAREVSSYLVAKHTIAMKQLRPLWNNGIDLQDAKDFVKSVEADPDKRKKYDDFGVALNNFNNALLKMMWDAGLMTRKEYLAQLKAYGPKGEHYLPQLRRRESKKNSFYSSTGYLKPPKGTFRRSIKGSADPLIDPIEATIIRAIAAFDNAMKQQVVIKLVKEVDPRFGGAEGMGSLMEQIPPDMLPTKFPIFEIVDELVKEGVVRKEDAAVFVTAYRHRVGLINEPDAEQALIDYAIEMELIDENDPDPLDSAAEAAPSLESIIAIWRPNYKNPRGENIMRVVINGRPYLYEVHPIVAESLSGMSPLMRNAFIRTLGQSTRIMKGGAVAINTEFGMRQVFMDTHTAAIQSNDMGLVERATRPIINTVQTALTRIKLAKKNELQKLYDEFGGELMHELTTEERSRKTLLRKGRRRTIAERGRDFFPDLFSGTHGFVAQMVTVSDTGPRLAEFEASLRNQGYVFSKGKIRDLNTQKAVTPPRDVIIRAINAAADVTYNYKRIGKTTLVVENAVPFLNAAIQSAAKSYRTFRSLPDVFRNEPKKGLTMAASTAYRGGSAAVKTAALYKAGMLAFTGVAAAIAWALDDDDHEDADEQAYGKYRGLNFGKGGVTNWYFPYSRDYALVGGLVQAELNKHHRGEKNAIRNAILEDLKMRVPSVGGLLGAGYGLLRNEDPFFGTPIEHDFYKREHIPMADRYDARTHILSRVIAESEDALTNKIYEVTGAEVGLSPLQIDFLLSELTGGAYHRLNSLGENVIRGDLDLSDVPFWGGVNINRHQKASIGEFYTELDRLGRLAGREEYERGEMSREDKDKLEMLKDYQALMSQFHAAQRTTKDREAKTIGDRLIVGLAREALGKESHESNPSPFVLPVRQWPKQFKEKQTGNDGRSVYQHTIKFIQDRVDLLHDVGKPQSGNNLDARLKKYAEDKRKAAEWVRNHRGKPLVSRVVTESSGLSISERRVNRSPVSRSSN